MSSLREQDALAIQRSIENPEVMLASLFAKLVYVMLACSEGDANIATAGAARLVHDSVVARLLGKFLMASIKYAEIAVKTESP